MASWDKLVFTHLLAVWGQNVLFFWEKTHFSDPREYCKSLMYNDYLICHPLAEGGWG